MNAKRKLVSAALVAITSTLLYAGNAQSQSWENPYAFSDGKVTFPIRGRGGDFDAIYINGNPVFTTCPGCTDEGPNSRLFTLPLAYWNGVTHTITRDWGMPRTFSEPRPSFAHVKHFGYWYSTYKDAGGNSTVTAEVADHANTMIVFGFFQSAFPDPWSDVKDLLNEVKSLGKKAILIIPAWGTYGDGNLYNCPLNVGWQQRLDSWSAAISPYLADGTIAAFFSIDEPKGGCVAAASTVISYTKSLRPTVPIWTNMDGADIGGAWPAGSDWIGFDTYGTSFDVIESKFAYMKSRLFPGQRTVLVPEGTNYARPTDDYVFAAIADNYLNLARDPSVIAVVPFMWRSLEFTSINSLPVTKARYKTFGQSYVGQ